MHIVSLIYRSICVLTLLTVAHHDREHGDGRHFKLNSGAVEAKTGYPKFYDGKGCLPRLSMSMPLPQGLAACKAVYNLQMPSNWS